MHLPGKVQFPVGRYQDRIGNIIFFGTQGTDGSEQLVVRQKHLISQPPRHLRLRFLVSAEQAKILVCIPE